jgi:hypothetical protein
MITRLHNFATKQRLMGVAFFAALVVGGAAYSYFTATGSGTGNAVVGTSSPWTVAQTSTSGTIYPGAGTATISYSVTNAGTGYQKLSGTTTAIASSSGNVTANGTAVSGCLASWFSTSGNTSPSGDVAPGAALTGSVNVTMTDAAASQDACQGVHPDVTISAS